MLSGFFTVIVLVIWRVDLLYFYGYHVYIIESYCPLCLTVTFVSYTSILFKFRFRNSSSAPLCSCFKTKKTNRHIVYNNFSIFTVVATIQYFSYCSLVKWYLEFPFSPRTFPFGLFIAIFVLCKLPCKSHFIHNQDARL